MITAVIIKIHSGASWIDCFNFEANKTEHWIFVSFFSFVILQSTSFKPIFFKIYIVKCLKFYFLTSVSSCGKSMYSRGNKSTNTGRYDNTPTVNEHYSTYIRTDCVVTRHKHAVT